MGKKREEKDLEKKKKEGTPCCAREGVRKGAWTAEEDKILVDFITHNGHGTWRNLPEFAGLLRCGKSCRLRWTNYLRPDIKRGPFSPEEEDKIVYLHGMLGNKWAAIASHLPGRTDNDVKNFWNSHLRKRFNKCKGSSSVDMKPDNPPVARRVNNPSPLNASSDTTKSKGDYFLHLWNSNVGESFRNVNESAEEHGGPASHSANSQTSSLTRAESGSRSTNLVEQKVEVFKCKKEAEEDLVSKSCEMEDSSDAMMKMLLDFPVGDNDMGFLEPATR